jgi:hypothetical protein
MFQDQRSEVLQKLGRTAFKAGQSVTVFFDLPSNLRRPEYERSKNLWERGWFEALEEDRRRNRGVLDTQCKEDSVL